jgi:hypothetical protein
VPAGSTGRTSLDLVATYDVTARLRFDTGTIAVSTVLLVTNTSGGAIDRLELNTVAAALGSMELRRATADGVAVDAERSGQTILVPLGRSLPVGAQTRVEVAYRATFRSATSGHTWLWSRANGVVSAYRWIPWVSRRVPFERDNHGDPFVTPVSPIVQVAITTDRPALFATSGRRVAVSGLTQHFEARDVRDFNFTASPSYVRTVGTTADGETPIRVFTRRGDAGTMLAWARRAIAHYEERVGRYPYPWLTIGESSGGYAMESPAHIWIPSGASSSSLPYLVAHEVAHQWFYAVVGNDQAQKPWADEAIAEYMTRDLLGTLRASRCSTAYLDRTIHEYSDACYYEIVYIQGANFLDALRARMGTARFWATVADYYRENRYELSGTKRLLETLRAAAGDDVLPMYRARFPRYY